MLRVLTNVVQALAPAVEHTRLPVTLIDAVLDAPKLSYARAVSVLAPSGKLTQENS